MSRRRISRIRSRRIFSNTARRTHKQNIRGTLPRGGYRM